MKKIFIIFLLITASVSVSISQDMAIDYETDLGDLTLAPREPVALTNAFLQRGLFTINYNLSFPLGDFNDFTSTIGYRGWDLELYGVINDNLAVGGSIGWRAFYEKLDRATYTFEGGALTSEVYNYFYSIPIKAVAHYYFLPDAFVQPFAGLSTGIAYNEKRREIGFYYVESRLWNYIVSPEVGVLIPFGEMAEWGARIVGRYNFMTFSDNSVDNIQFIDLSFGLVYSY
jgi:hypothetical protein